MSSAKARMTGMFQREKTPSVVETVSKGKGAGREVREIVTGRS